MPPSQLKQLKTSLREHGVIGPQKSKKEKKRTANQGSDAQKKFARHEALQGIRERFNPFEVKAPSRKVKFDVTSARTLSGAPVKGVQGRPTITKAVGEQRRKETLLTELHRRNKVGGITDRRFGEDDPSLTPEQRAAERYARESERRLKKSTIFNLEDDEDDYQLTHAGREIQFGDEVDQQDDFDETDLQGSSDEASVDENGDGPRKRRRLSMDDEEEDADVDLASETEETLERPKTKKEVMEEVIAKSKLYRYERQKAKEEDDDLRAELDKGLSEFYELMRQQPRKPTEPEPATGTSSTAMMNPERAALLMGKGKKTAEEEYNERVRQMALDLRSKPSERTKTEEEKFEEEAARLRELEAKRLKRMQGEDEDEDEHSLDGVEHPDDDVFDDAEAFGLGQPEESYHQRKDLDVEDEDEFLIDEDLVASDPDADVSLSEGDEASDIEESDEDDTEFIGDLTLPDLAAPKDGINLPSSDGLAFTYPCPTTHAHFLEITKKVKVEDLPIVVQRIRALYHPKLKASNKSKLEVFSRIIIQHVAYLARQEAPPPASVIESLLRHVHSMAKSFPLAVGLEFRAQLTEMCDERPLFLDAGDLVLLTGVLHIFPTSDHFHSVVTPALLTMARYMAQSSISSLGDLSKGIYCTTLALEYQTLSRRYIPEVMLFLLNTLLSLAPVEYKDVSRIISYRAPTVSLRIQKAATLDHTPLEFWSIMTGDANDEVLKAKLFSNCLTLLESAAGLWSEASAFIEIFNPACTVLDHLLSKSCKKSLSPDLITQTHSVFSTLQGLLARSQKHRKPLALHNHRPLAIKLAVPKFDESFNPDRHNDPDRERAEIGKLKAEHKRERKGALRELRKDANFLARESLRDKKERDAAYEAKYRRLVAEIQSEEGKESNAYDKEKRKRRGDW